MCSAVFAPNVVRRHGAAIVAALRSNGVSRDAGFMAASIKQSIDGEWNFAASGFDAGGSPTALPRHQRWAYGRLSEVLSVASLGYPYRVRVYPARCRFSLSLSVPTLVALDVRMYPTA
jgi:hypothetical protein